MKHFPTKLTMYDCKNFTYRTTLLQVIKLYKHIAKARNLQQEMRKAVEAHLGGNV